MIAAASAGKGALAGPTRTETKSSATSFVAELRVAAPGIDPGLSSSRATGRTDCERVLTLHSHPIRPFTRIITSPSRRRLPYARPRPSSPAPPQGSNAIIGGRKQRLLARTPGANGFRPAPARRRWPGSGARRAHPPARARARGDDWHHGLRQQRADASRHHFPARLYHEADHRSGRHDSRGGMQGQARRSGRRVAAGAEGPQGPADDREPARRHGASEAPHHSARPAHLSIGVR